MIIDAGSNANYQITTASGADGLGGEVIYNGTNDINATEITVPDTITDSYGITYKVTRIANNAFANNKKLKTVTIGAYIVEIGNNAFKKCINLKKLVNKSSKLAVIGASAFSGDKNLTSINLSKCNIKVIGKNAFNGCKKLKTVKLNGNTLKTVGKNAFKNIKKNAKITIVTGKKANYKKVINIVKKSGSGKVKYSHKKK